MTEQERSIETQFYRVDKSELPWQLRSGEALPEITLAYETWGALNADASNAILLNHALSGSHHVRGYNPSIPGVLDLWQKEMHHGWWEEFVGPDKAIDTNKFFVICPNYLGGCYGSTGPKSINPETGKPYGSKFPELSVADQADLQVGLVKSLGIQQLHAAIGPSVGGLITLTLATRHPEFVRIVIPMTSGFKTTVLNRLILFEQILAIENDPHFHAGDYYDSSYPDYGLALARMISHKTFVHLDTFEKRVRSDVRNDQESLKWYKVKDPFQSYMLYQGKKFVKRFDANTYLRIIDMWSRYDAVKEADAADAAALFAPAKKAGQKYLVFSIDSDFCFYPEEQALLASSLKDAEVDSMYITVHSDKGHDSFLLEPDLYSPHIRSILSSPFPSIGA